MSSKWINKNLFNSYVEQKEQDKENNDKASNRNDIAWKTPERGTVDNPKIYEGRFLPDPKGKFTKKYYYHMYQSAGKWFFQLCEKTFNFENWCPWCSAVSKLYQGTSADKKAASNFKRKVRHIGNWFVVDDPRDNEIDDENRKSGGKVKIYEFPTQVESKINGEIMDRKRGAGARVFDPGDDGLNFILKVKATRPDKNKRVFPDYSDSKFSNSSSSIGTDKEIKNIYNLDNAISASKWVREKVKNNKNILKPSLNGPLKVKDSKTLISENSLGYMHNNANNVGFNPTYVGIYSSTFASAHGLSITKDNYMDVVSLFLARKSIPSNWINQKDEYMAPTEEVQNSDKYKQFNNDAIVYSLFNTSSNQSSMRQVEYKDKLWDIKNEFFWMNNEEMLELAEEYKFDELYKDARTSKDRYVYDLLKSTPLSPDAKELLEMSKELIRKSFEWRKIMHQSNPDYHLNAWDAGWYQIKKILNEHFKEEYKIFVEKYKKFENRLRPQVYELGFLKSDEVVEPHGIGIMEKSGNEQLCLFPEM